MFGKQRYAVFCICEWYRAVEVCADMANVGKKEVKKENRYAISIVQNG